jgi:hypothetical protein
MPSLQADLLGSIKADAGGDFYEGEVDVADAELGIVASGGREQVIFIKKKATSNKQARREHDFTESAQRQSKLSPETAQRLLLLFAPQGQTVAGGSCKFKAQLLDRFLQLERLAFVDSGHIHPKRRITNDRLQMTN